MFCNDRYLEIYGLTRSDIATDMTGPELLELRRKRGVLDVAPTMTSTSRRQAPTA